MRVYLRLLVCRAVGLFCCLHRSRPENETIKTKLTATQGIMATLTESKKEAKTQMKMENKMKTRKPLKMKTKTKNKWK